MSSQNWPIERRLRDKFEIITKIYGLDEEINLCDLQAYGTSSVNDSNRLYRCFMRELRHWGSCDYKNFYISLYINTMICTFTSLHCSFIFNSSIHPENPNFIEWSYVELHVLCCLFVQNNPNPSPKFIIYLTPVTCVKWLQKWVATGHASNGTLI